MCWIGKNNRQSAKEDISVFKIVNYDLRSFYYYFQYSKNATYRMNLRIPDKPMNRIRIDCGFHSYVENEVFVKYTYDNSVYRIYSSNMHLELDNFDNRDNVVKLNCIIPKGSVYYKNDNGEIVSDTLKVIDVEKIFV